MEIKPTYSEHTVVSLVNNFRKQCSWNIGRATNGSVLRHSYTVHSVHSVSLFKLIMRRLSCARLSWLYVRFWAHVKLTSRIVSYDTRCYFNAPSKASMSSESTARNRKLKSWRKNIKLKRICSEVSVNSLGSPCPGEENEGSGEEDLQRRKLAELKCLPNAQCPCERQQSDEWHSNDARRHRRHRDWPGVV